MTNEEAIKRLKETQDARVMSICGTEVDKVETEIWQEAVKIAVDALEKQIPKKLILFEEDFMFCPNCGYKWEKWLTGNKYEWLKYCWHCGQAIDWEEEK